MSRMEGNCKLSANVLLSHLVTQIEKNIVQSKHPFTLRYVAEQTKARFWSFSSFLFKETLPKAKYENAIIQRETPLEDASAIFIF